MVEVSIITPTFNSGKYISSTIESVINQTFYNWEMIIVDDCSTDDTLEIVKEYSKKDSRIKCTRLDRNSGSASTPRNKGLKLAKGRFIAFLDSDDVWIHSKLMDQLPLLKMENTAIVYSNYEKIDVNGNRNNRIIKAPSSTNYKHLLKGNVIACSTAMYDSKKVGDVLFQEMGHEDFAFWLSILKKGFIAQNTDTILTFYRVRKSSLSSNKLKASRWVWKIYREVEQISYIKSTYYLIISLTKSFFKYLK